MKNRTAAGIFYLDSLTVYDYYPYGMLKPDRYFEGLWSRYGFNGMEKDDDIKGKGNSYDFGARVYDPRTIRFYSVDGKANEFPEQSAYIPFDDSPILKNDPDGLSAKVQARGNTITVSATIYFYGSKANNTVAKASAKEIQNKWNEPKATVTIDGKQYKVKFKIEAKVVTQYEAIKIAANNTSAENNFVKVEDSKASNKPISRNRSEMPIGGNSGYFVTTDDLGKSTTAPHEFGHGLGLLHPSGYLIGLGIAPIMAARGSLVDPQFTYNKNDPKSPINPKLRSVTDQEVEAVFSTVTLDSQGNGKIGNATNNIYPNKSDQKESAVSLERKMTPSPLPKPLQTNCLPQP